jgi:hypothetical protein
MGNNNLQILLTNKFNGIHHGCAGKGTYLKRRMKNIIFWRHFFKKPFANVKIKTG